MEVIIGGMYQGKHRYLHQKYGALPPAALLDNLEQWVSGCMEQGKEPLAELELLLHTHPPQAVVCTDIFCGIVPLNAKERLWREHTGRCLALACARADHVTRLFCGIATPLRS